MSRALLAALAAVSALGPRAAEAIPAFARKYTAPCLLCHDRVYPALNEVGGRFKENGYQFDDGTEGAPRETRGVTPNPDERLQLLDQLPLAMRAQTSAVVATDPRSTGRNAIELRPFESLYLLAGASVFPDISFFASATLFQSLALHQAAIGFHSLFFGRGHLNLRVGRLLLLDFQRPEHRFLTGFGNPIATTRVGLNPTALDSSQHGADIYGRLLGRRVFYRVALVQGAQAPDGVADLDPHKDLFGEIHLDLIPRLTFGLLGLWGRTQITDETRGVSVRFTDPFQVLGASVELATTPVNLFAQALYVNHDDPFGRGEHADYWGFRVEARAFLSPRWYLVGRYDQLASHHLEEERFRHVTVHLGWLLLSNLRIGAESAAPLDAIEESAFSLRLDLAM